MRLFKLILLCLFVLAVYSCKSEKTLSNHDKVLPPIITLNKLYKNVEENKLAFKTISSKKLDISIIDGKKNRSLKGSIKIERDSFIQVSLLAPLGIEAMRILMTKDSVKLINYLEKYYVLDDYNYFEENYGANINFNFIQNFFSNNAVFSLDEDEIENLKKFKLDRLENKYIVSSVQERAISRKVKKYFKKREKNKEYALILQKTEFSSDYFRPIFNSIEDIEENSGISVKYSMFDTIDSTYIPSKMSVTVFNEDIKYSIVIVYQKIDINNPVSISFKIPSKYTRKYLENSSIL